MLHAIHRSLLGLLLLAFAFPASAQPAGGGLLVDADSAAPRLAPVLASDVHVEIAGVVARSRVTQIFQNPTDQPLEAVYVFPLPVGAAVDGLSMAVGGRAVHGRIAERGEAEETGRQALDEGRKTAVLARQGPDLFTVSLGALAPGEEVDVVLDLLQVVAVEDGRFTLRFPMVARPIPEGTDETATALAAPRRKTAGNAAGAATALVNPFDLHVDLYPGIRLGRIDSPSHPVEVAEKAGPLYTVDLARGAASADRDFVLTWEPIAGMTAQAALYSEERDGERYVLLLAIPPAGGPALSDVAVRWDDPEAETWPQSLPAVRAGTALVVAARLAPTASLAVISGRRGKEPWEVVLPLAGAAPGRRIAQLWARLKVEGLANGPADERAQAEARRQISELGRRYGLVTEETSLVAEDGVTIDDGSGPPLRAWVPLAEPVGVDVPRETSIAAASPESRLAGPPATSGVRGPTSAAPTALRARPAPARAALRRRLHHRVRHSRRYHRLHRRHRHRRARSKPKAPPVPPAAPAAPTGNALTPRDRLGAQSQRR